MAKLAPFIVPFALFAFVGSADARTRRPKPAEPAAEAEAEAEADALPEEPIDPAVEAFKARLDPEARAVFESLDDDALGELVARVERGETASPQERAIVDAFQAQYMESFEAELDYRTGDVSIADGLATLHLGEEFRYLGPEQADRILVEAWGNPPGAETLGMIFPADVSPLEPGAGWGVVITYSQDGHVEDDDADDIDYDELLEEMKKDTEAENAARSAQGYPPMHLAGWAETPHYQEAEHRLYWAKELKVDGDPESSLNYAIRVLGRKGVLELNAVAGISQISDIKPQMEAVLSRVEFESGNRYTDFDPDLDSVAAYGIGGLIAGKVLAKAGFFAIILKFLIAAKKLIVVGAIALFAGIKAMFGRGKTKDDDVA